MIAINHQRILISSPKLLKLRRCPFHRCSSNRNVLHVLPINIPAANRYRPMISRGRALLAVKPEQNIAKLTVAMPLIFWDDVLAVHRNLERLPIPVISEAWDETFLGLWGRLLLLLPVWNSVVHTAVMALACLDKILLVLGNGGSRHLLPWRVLFLHPILRSWWLFLWCCLLSHKMLFVLFLCHLLLLFLCFLLLMHNLLILPIWILQLLFLELLHELIILKDSAKVLLIRTALSFTIIFSLAS